MNKNYFLGILITAVMSYLLGSINFAIIISGKSGDDIRKHGSGNAGMTNMLRTYGKKVAVITALGDFLKGVVAVLISRYIIFPFFGITNIDAGYIAGFLVLIGHVYPVFFGFKGGKGVMTALGIMFILDPIVFIAVSAVGIISIVITKTVSIGSLMGAACLPIFTLIYRIIQKRPFLYDTVMCLLLSLFVAYTHRDNIRRLLAKDENRFGKKKK